MAQSCTDINAKYLDNLEKAKHCDARLPSTKCDHKVKDSLCGGCDTLVDPAQTAAVQQLASLAQQWDALSCSTVLACVMPKCQVPTGATCVYGGPGDCFGGCCVDTYP